MPSRQASLSWISGLIEFEGIEARVWSGAEEVRKWKKAKVTNCSCHAVVARNQEI